MPSGYWSGLVEGFQGRREAESDKNYKKEQENRAMADRVFGHLLASRDPQMQELALQGLMQPIDKKKGFKGFMGEVERNPFMAQVIARMNEMVPGETPGQAPATPGGAAMSTNQPVHAGSQMVGTQLPPEAPPTAGELPTQPPPELGMGPGGGGGRTPGGVENPMQPPQLGPTGGPDAAATGMLGAPPPESPYKRRGTGVPTAEEIAEMQARIPMETKIKVATEQLTQAGATPEEIQRTIMGMLGAPQNQRQFAAPTFGVKTPDGKVHPVSFDYTTGRYAWPDGTPVPADAEFVRMSATTGAGLTSTIRDSPEIRAQYGIEPSEVTTSGYWKIKQLPDGSSMVMPSEYTPPPAYAGTTVIQDPSNPQVPVRAPILRGGGTGPALGDEPSAVKSQTQLDAEALLAAVEDTVKLQTSSNLLKRSPTPQQRDQIVREKAQQQGLPYMSYDDLVRAAKSATPVTARERSTGGTVAERVRQRALQNRGGGPSGTRPPVRPALPPAEPIPAPPIRARGAGPVGQ